MKYNRILALAACSLVLVGTSFAQDNPPSPDGNSPSQDGPPRRGNPLDQVDQTLNLTADQKAKIDPLIAQAKSKIQSTPGMSHEDCKAIVDSTLNQIKPMLTAEQQQKLASLQNRGPRGNPADHLAQVLGLSDQQKAQVKAIFEASRPQMQAIHQDDSLSREEKMGKMMEVFAADKVKISAILTDEQKAKLATLKGPGEHQGQGEHQGPPPGEQN